MTLLEPQTQGIPVPRTMPVSAPFWEGTRRGELMYQHCRQCNSAVFNPALICRYCGAPELDWRVSNGAGSVYSWTIAHTAPSKDFRTPFAPAIVDVDEGFQIVTNIIGCSPNEVRVGQPVHVEFHAISEGFYLPYFRPATDESNRY